MSTPDKFITDTLPGWHITIIVACVIYLMWYTLTYTRPFLVSIGRSAFENTPPPFYNNRFSTVASDLSPPGTTGFVTTVVKSPFTGGESFLGGGEAPVFYDIGNVQSARNMRQVNEAVYDAGTDTVNVGKVKGDFRSGFDGGNGWKAAFTDSFKPEESTGFY